MYGTILLDISATAMIPHEPNKKTPSIRRGWHLEKKNTSLLISQAFCLLDLAQYSKNESAAEASQGQSLHLS